MCDHVGVTRVLFLLRHGEADFAAPTDVDRELTEFGQAQATGIGEEFAAMDPAHRPTVILSSTAQRCRQTTDAVVAAAGLRLGDGTGGTTRVEYHQALYLAEPDTIMARIGEIEDEAGSVLVVAHSPGLPLVAAELLAGAQGEDGDVRCAFPPAGMHGFVIPGSWEVFTTGEFAGVTPLA